jgi:hypothetical protein
MIKFLSMLVLVLASSTAFAETIYDCADAGNTSCSDTVKRVGGLNDGQRAIEVCVERCTTVNDSIESNLNDNHANGEVWACKVDSITVTDTVEDERYGGTLVYCDCGISCKTLTADEIGEVEPQQL